MTSKIKIENRLYLFMYWQCVGVSPINYISNFLRTERLNESFFDSFISSLSILSFLFSHFLFRFKWIWSMPTLIIVHSNENAFFFLFTSHRHLILFLSLSLHSHFVWAFEVSFFSFSFFFSIRFIWNELKRKWFFHSKKSKWIEFMIQNSFICVRRTRVSFVFVE